MLYHYIIRYPELQANNSKADINVHVCTLLISHAVPISCVMHLRKFMDTLETMHIGQNNCVA